MRVENTPYALMTVSSCYKGIIVSQVCSGEITNVFQNSTKTEECVPPFDAYCYVRHIFSKCSNYRKSQMPLRPGSCDRVKFRLLKKWSLGP